VAHIIRASTPPRGTDCDEYREILWSVARKGDAPLAVRVDIVGCTDAVELEVTLAGRVRPRLRFLRDTTARSFAARMHAKLLGRGFLDAR
jgi:hypothetical protein